MIEKKNKLRLEREQVPGFETVEFVKDVFATQGKSMAKPEGTGKKKKKKQPQINADIWLGNV